MTERTAFVIGARGFIGSNTVRALLGAGWSVHCFGPAMEPDLLADLKGQIVNTQGSVEDTDAMTRAMTRAGADVVLSFAAFSEGTGGLAKSGEIDATRAFEINVNGLRHTFDAALQAGVDRVVWSSSTTIYGPADRYPNAPIDESAEPRPQGVYGLTKANGEQLSTYYRDRHGLETIAVRLPLVFGPGLWYRGAAAALMQLFEAARPGTAHTLRGPSAPLDLMYAPDCAEALAAIAGHDGPLPERLNINGFTTTFAEIASVVEAAVPGFSAAFEEIAPPVIYPLIRTDLMETVVGYRPRFGLRDAVLDLLANDRSH